MENVTKPQWKFFRSEMATIVWDPDKNAPMAEFKDGVFVTDDKRVAITLRKKGYIEIPMDAESPPKTIKVIPSPKRTGDIPLMPGAQAKMDGSDQFANEINNQMNAVVDVPRATSETVVEGAPVVPSRIKPSGPNDNAGELSIDIPEPTAASPD